MVDPIFMTAGVATSCLAVIPAIRNNRRPHSRSWRAMLLWGIFSAGLLVQAFAPHLRVHHNAFVMPLESMASPAPIDPVGIVARERWMQVLACLLTLGAAIGLSVHYLPVLLAPHPQQGTPQPFE